MDASDDPARPLTGRGRDDVARLADAAADLLDPPPGRIVHSGKARARETAEVLAEAAGTGCEEADGLAPNDDPATWAGRLADEGEGSVVLVGHNPHLERLVGLLVHGDPARPAVGFGTAGLVALEGVGDDWAVTTTIDPRDP